MVVFCLLHARRVYKSNRLFFLLHLHLGLKGIKGSLRGFFFCFLFAGCSSLGQYLIVEIQLYFKVFYSVFSIVFNGFKTERLFFFLQFSYKKILIILIFIFKTFKFLNSIKIILRINFSTIVNPEIKYIK